MEMEVEGRKVFSARNLFDENLSFGWGAGKLSRSDERPRIIQIEATEETEECESIEVEHQNEDFARLVHIRITSDA
jgi:hypothetical protein